jgi:hypothetical protein
MVDQVNALREIRCIRQKVSSVWEIPRLRRLSRGAYEKDFALSSHRNHGSQGCYLCHPNFPTRKGR